MSNITLFIDERELSEMVRISNKYNIWLHSDEIVCEKQIMKPFNYKLSMDSEKLGKKFMPHIERGHFKDRLQNAGHFQVGWSRTYV